MEDLFIGFYRPDEKEFKELWENCHFVFDANMLLNVYRYSELARETLIEVFQKLNERIWIPHQVGIEYHFHVLEEIKGQEKKYDELQNIIRTKTTQIEEEYKSFSLRHSNLKMDEKLLKSFQDSVNELCNDLENQKENHPDLNITKNEIMKVFTNKVGSPYDQEQIEKIENEGEIRYDLKQPPGFRDIKKEGIRYHDERTYQQKYGDLILWNQLIDYSKDKEIPIIFITDDRKDDWWNSINGEKVGPSPQLLQEFKKKTNGNKFYMYQPKQFLGFINNFLDIGIDNTTIESAIKNIDDYKKQVEKVPVMVKGPRAPRIQIRKNGELVSRYIEPTDIYVETEDIGNGLTVERVKKRTRPGIFKEFLESSRKLNEEENINSYLSQYLLTIRLPEQKSDHGLGLLSKTKSTLKELLPSNEIQLDPISMGSSTVTIKITITGPRIANPNLIEIFLEGRLADMGCSIESFDKYKNREI